MTDAALEIYNNISKWSDLEGLISDGETEGLHLECKSPLGPSLNRDLKNKLAIAASGFSNTAGGVVLWGMATTKHSHSSLDVISQIEPIGNCANFEKQVKAAIPALTTPSILDFQTKLIKKRNTDTRGVVAAYIPLTTGDPLISNNNNIFYFRSSDGFVPAPYELIKRLFSVTDVPDLYPQFTKEIVEVDADGSWKIPIVVDNRAPAFAEYVDVAVTIENPSACESINATDLVDNSGINPGKKIFMVALSRGIHRYMPVLVGSLKIKMKKGARAKRRLDISISIYASRMQSRKSKFALSLAKSGFSVKKISDELLR